MYKNRSQDLPVKKMLIAIGLIALVLFIVFRFRSLVAGPQVTVEYPADHQTLVESFVTVTGSVRHVSALIINGHEVLPTVDNRFSYALLAPPGYSILSVYATDRFGKEFTRDIPIYVDLPPDDTDIMAIDEPPPEDEPEEVEPDETTPVPDLSN